MKHIQLIRTAMAVVAATVAITGCSRFEEEDFFEESPSLRIEHAAQDLQETLVNAPQGWVMQFHVGTGAGVFPGYNLFAKFENNGKVTLAGNHPYLRDGNANTYTEASSLYQMIKEEGLVLAFNTWNDILTPFVDPVAPYAAPKDLIKDGAGMEGDQNFVVVSYNDDEVIMRGERHRAEVRLVKADRAWEDYIADTEAFKASITNSTITSYYLTTSSDTLYYVGLRNGRYRKSERIVDPLHVDSISCCFTPNGFRNEHSDELGGHKFQEFTLAEDKSCLVNEDGTVKVIPTWDTYIINRTSLWTLDPSYFTAEQQDLYDRIAAELLKANKNYVLESINFGRTTGAGAVTGLVLRFYTTSRKTTTNMAGLAMDFTRPQFGQMDIAYSDDAATDNNMNALTRNAAELPALVKAFAASVAGRYNMTPDDYFLPKGAVLTSTDGTKTLGIK